MGSVARLAAVGSAVALAACAVIAGLGDPSTVGETTSGSSSSGSVQDTGNASSSGGSSSSGSSGSDGSSSSGTPADAQPDVPQCSLLKNGDNCTQPSQCCSGKCNEKKMCANDCTNAGTFNCDPISDDDCCVGLWCNAGSCSGCIGQGQPAAESFGVRLARSCCSRSLEGGFGPNCQ